MMKYRLYIFLLFVSIGYVCSSHKPTNENAKLISIIDSKVFKTYFKICEKESDTIKIYNNQSDILYLKPFKIDCGKTVLIEKSNLTIDVNSSVMNREDKILLHKIEKIKSQYIFSFIDIHSNATLALAINNKNKIEIIRKGTF